MAFRGDVIRATFRYTAPDGEGRYVSVKDLSADEGKLLRTAIEHSTSLVPIASPTALIGDIRRSLEGRHFDSVAEIVVCEDGHLVGFISLKDLLSAASARPSVEVMDPDPPYVGPGVDRELVAWRAVHRGGCSIAVVDEHRTFLGLIPPERIIEVLLQEHAEDLARLGGYLHSAASARAASAEPMLRRLWHRLPWLIVGLAGAVGSAQLMSGFEEALRSHIVLAFFLPGIVYLADAVGTQTETLIVRGLSVGVPIGGVVRQELMTGLTAGLILALLFLPVALLIWGDGGVAAAVTVSLFAACLIATAVGIVLPWMLDRFGWDPAFGTGPLSTVIQDLCSIAIYLAIADVLVS